MRLVTIVVATLQKKCQETAALLKRERVKIESIYDTHWMSNKAAYVGEQCKLVYAGFKIKKKGGRQL